MLPIIAYFRFLRSFTYRANDKRCEKKCGSAAFLFFSSLRVSDDALAVRHLTIGIHCSIKAIFKPFMLNGMDKNQFPLLVAVVVHPQKWHISFIYVDWISHIHRQAIEEWENCIRTLTYEKKMPTAINAHHFSRWSDVIARLARILFEFWWFFLWFSIIFQLLRYLLKKSQQITPYEYDDWKYAQKKREFNIQSISY